MKKLVVFIFLAFSLVAFQQIEIQEFIIPNNWPEPSYDFEVNPLTKKQIQLGRALFYDPILSQNNIISCASCHSQYNAFTHVDHQLSHGIIYVGWCGT